jgi:adenylyl- and sulfurtransferase ThiI
MLRAQLGRLQPDISVTSWGGWLRVKAALPVDFVHRCSKLPGVEMVLAGRVTAADLKSITKLLLESAVASVEEGGTYSVRVRCPDGSCDEAGLEMGLTSRLVGEMRKRRCRPSDRGPDFVLQVLISEGKAFVGRLGLRGDGGVVSGLHGKCVCLFSGSEASLLATMEANRAGFLPVPLFVLKGGISLPSLRRLITTACYLRDRVPVDRFTLRIVDYGRSGRGVGVVLERNPVLHHTFLRECALSLCRKVGSTCVATGLHAVPGTALLLDCYEASGFHFIHPLLGWDDARIERELDDEIRRKAVRSPKEQYHAEKSPLSDDSIRQMAEDCVSNSVELELERYDKYHLAIDRAVELLREKFGRRL